MGRTRHKRRSFKPPGRKKKEDKDFKGWFEDWEKAINSPAGKVLLAGVAVEEEKSSNSLSEKSTGDKP